VKQLRYSPSTGHNAHHNICLDTIKAAGTTAAALTLESANTLQFPNECRGSSHLSPKPHPALQPYCTLVFTNQVPLCTRFTSQ
jgi:hypothetical protein